MNHMVPFLTATMKVKNKDFIDYIIRMWENDKLEFIQNTREEQFANEMNLLIGKAKAIKY